MFSDRTDRAGPTSASASLLDNPIQRRCEAVGRSVDIGELVETEQAETEGRSRVRFAADQRNAGRHLHPGRFERLTLIDAREQVQPL